MGINGESGVFEGLGHDDGSGFVTDAGEGFEIFEVVRDVSVVFFEENFGEAMDGTGFDFEEAAGVDGVFDRGDGKGGHFLWGVGKGEEMRCDEIDAGIGALS